MRKSHNNRDKSNCYNGDDEKEEVADVETGKEKGCKDDEARDEVRNIRNNADE